MTSLHSLSSPWRERTPPQGSALAVAVSGGVDSLMALLLLQEQGYDVHGVHAFFLPPDDAARANADKLGALCDSLGAPFTALDLHREFEERVIQPFIQEYAAARTPNPCACCNAGMKFGLLFERFHGEAPHIDWIATGHYARVGEHGQSGDIALFRGVDPGKDQSYFLSLVQPEQLRRAVFPLGGWTKDQVREAVAERGVTPPAPVESQEICFIPNDDYRAFLLDRERRGLARLPGGGDIRLQDGRRLAKHKGLWQYTPGQRRGLGTPWKAPLYVLEKNAGENTLIVGEKHEMASAGCVARDVVLHRRLGEWPELLFAQTRYRQKAAPVVVEFEPKDSGRMTLRAHAGHSPPAPGQIAAVYDEGGAVLAAGVIEHNIPEVQVAEPV